MRHQFDSLLRQKHHICGPLLWFPFILLKECGGSTWSIQVWTESCTTLRHTNLGKRVRLRCCAEALLWFTRDSIVHERSQCWNLIHQNGCRTFHSWWMFHNFDTQLQEYNKVVIQLDIIDLDNVTWNWRAESHQNLLPGYPDLTAFSAKWDCMVETTNLCEQVFSAMRINKTKLHSRPTHKHLNPILKLTGVDVQYWCADESWKIPRIRSQTNNATPPVLHVMIKSTDLFYITEALCVCVNKQQVF